MIDLAIEVIDGRELSCRCETCTSGLARWLVTDGLDGVVTRRCNGCLTIVLNDLYSQAAGYKRKPWERRRGLRGEAIAA